MGWGIAEIWECWVMDCSKCLDGGTVLLISVDCACANGKIMDEGTVYNVANVDDERTCKAVGRVVAY